MLRLAGLVIVAAALLATCLVPAAETIDGCTDCTRNNCGAENEACFNNTECTRLVGCVVECPEGESDCIAGCAEGFPDGVALSFDLANCLAQSCASDCPSLLPAAGGSGGSSAGGAGGGS